MKIKEELEKSRKQAEKSHRFYFLLVHWVEILQEQRSLVTYFEANGYRSIAIYGMKELGQRLYDELKGSSVAVKYCIDVNAEELYSEVDIVNPDSFLEDVDVIIVTPIYDFEAIKVLLARRVDFPIVSLEDVVFGV